MDTELKIAAIFQIRGITANAKLMLILLEIAKRSYTQAGKVITLKEFEDWLGCSEKTVCNSLAVLKEHDLITFEDFGPNYAHSYNINELPETDKLPGREWNSG